jgi:hypothetical protein
MFAIGDIDGFGFVVAEKTDVDHESYARERHAGAVG